MIKSTDLPPYIRYGSKSKSEEGYDFEKGFDNLVDGYERNLIIQALEKHNFNKFQTAKTLKMNRSTFMSKLKKYNIN